MLFLVDRHSSLLVGICMECIKERYMPVLLSSISLFGKALFYTQFGMASDPVTKQPIVMKILRPYQDPRYPTRATLSGRQMCQVEALLWNRKFSPGIYIGLASLLKEYQENDHEIHIGEIIEDLSKVDTKADVEYVLLMRQLPEDRCLETLLDKQNKETHARLKLLTQYIAQLHMDVNLLAMPLADEGDDNRWGSYAQLQDKLKHNIE